MKLCKRRAADPLLANIKLLLKILHDQESHYGAYYTMLDRGLFKRQDKNGQRLMKYCDDKCRPYRRVFRQVIREVAHYIPEIYQVLGVEYLSVSIAARPQKSFLCRIREVVV